MIIVLMGAPGCGKGTQANLLSRRYEIPHISTGEILRDAVGKGGILGKADTDAVLSGGMVDDGTVLGLLDVRIEDADCRDGFLLDGYPRTLVQAKALDSVFKRRGVGLDAAVLIDVPRASLEERLLNRVVDRRTGASYHVHHGVPPGADVEKRPDDRPEAVNRRLSSYDALQAPVIARYSSILHRVDGTGSADEVCGRILRALRYRGLYVVRLYDGFDNQWMDVSEPVSKAQADKIWKEKTRDGTEKTSFDHIDYYKVFPADTRMAFSEGFGER